MSSIQPAQCADPRAAGVAARLASVRAELSAIGVEVADAGPALGVEALFELAGVAQGVVNAAEGVTLVVSARGA